MLLPSISSFFLNVFYPIIDTFHILVTLNLSSANIFHLDTSNIVSLGKQLKPFSTLFRLYHIGQCTFPCIPEVSFISNPQNILLKPLTAFTHNDRHDFSNIEATSAPYPCFHEFFFFNLTRYHTMPHFDALKIYSCGKHGKKRKNCL